MKLTTQGYIKIPIMFLEAESPAKVNIHIYMPLNRKVVSFRRKGEPLSLADVMTLTGLGASQALMLESEYAAALEELAGDVLAPESETTLGSHSQAVARVVIEQIANAKADQVTRRVTLDNAADLAKFVLTSMKGAPKSNYYQLILSELKNEDVFATHNRHVGALAALILMALGGYEKKDLTDITLAGFFHDAFLKDMPKAFQDKHLSGSDLSLEVLRAPELGYYRHIELVLKKFDDEKVGASASAMRVIVQHHENFDGSGLKGTRENAIYPPARILRIADDLICLMNCVGKEMTLQDAYARLCAVNSEGVRVIYDPELLAQLAPIFT